MFAIGKHKALDIKLEFKTKWAVLRFVLDDEAQYEKASYNARNGESDFPFYFSEAKSKIIEWGLQVYEENRVRPKQKDNGRG